ncbi:MAG: hypothetical protein H6506_05105 [Calditrichaeota bacterium]|nr:hypothetical protein [Calditrichota bacterium]MCB9392014.1 hypothetical protein [Calditrichota bacterium]
MSKRIRKLQRGAIDLMGIAVGLTIISITAIGTSYSLLYGRQALIQQEHYRTALFKLRGFMEEEMARMRFSDYYRGNQSWWGAPNDLAPYSLDVLTDRDGDIRPTYATIYRDPIEYVDDAITRMAPDYFRITAHAEWTEAAIPGITTADKGDDAGRDQQITLRTTFHLPR